MIKLYIAEPLTYIFNLCFLKGIFPNELKKSIVTPVYKKGDKSITENYRPISVINNIAKLLEMCMKSRLVKLLNDNELLSNSQFGFRENMSTGGCNV